MSLLGLLVVLLVFCLVYWAATKLLAAFSVGDPIRSVVIVVIVIVMVLWLIGQFGLISPLRIR